MDSEQDDKNESRAHTTDVLENDGTGALEAARNTELDTHPSINENHVRSSEDRERTSRLQQDTRRGSKDQSMRATSNSRNRGYSLRRSLFKQNISKQNDDHGAAIEMKTSSSRQETSPCKESVTGPAVLTIDASGILPETRKSRPISASDPILQTRMTPRKLSSGVHSGMDRVRTLFNRTIGTRELPPTADGRHVHVDVRKGSGPVDERTGKPYITNRIRSCKYTVWNFLPKQLVAQFGKLANFYFLVISILQLIPGLSTTGTFTTLVPLLIFVSISMAKELYDDLRRNRLDKEENERTALILNDSVLARLPRSGEGGSSIDLGSGCWTETKWHNLKVGDVVLLERDSAVPADLVLLHANGHEGSTYVETKSLDGETNLKSKKPLKLISSHSHAEAAIARLEAEFVVEDPNLDLYKFDGRVSIAGQTLPLTSSEVVYRGSVIRNTPVTIGIIVYSGEECKIRMNATKNPRVKAPNLQAKVNRVVIIVACLVLVIAIILSIGYIFWKRTTENRSWYLDEADVPYGQILSSFIIMLNTMLPLSLYISLEIVKVVQIFMMNDIDMYDPMTDTPMEPKTSNLNEELGQVSYIFSDKTGTLTNNSMKFRKCSVAGSAWLHDHDLLEEAEQEPRTKLRHKKRTPSKPKTAERRYNESETTAALTQGSPDQRAGGASSTQNAEHLLTDKTDDLLQYIYRRPQSVFARKARFFLLALSLCHTCLPEKNDNGEITFQAASPDEIALVTAAQDLGFIVTDRQSNTMTVRTYNEGGEAEPIYETYQILDVIEFSSMRKRMSILIKLPDGRICLFSKGADTIIRKLLARSDLAAMCVEDVRRKSEARKSTEVRAAMQRRGTGFDSISSSKPSRHSGQGRQSSISLGRRYSARESVDLWMREREAASTSPRQSDAYYTPRSSQAMHIRQHQSADSPRSSLQSGDFDSLIDESVVIDEHTVFQRTFSHIDDFASEGLRTLVYGHRFVPEIEYQQWKELYHKAATSLTDRQKKIEEAAEMIERNLELTGATAIEDKLQVGVPDAIERFRRAGIKMWMLTGDKRETAINIGHSCHLIKDYSTVMVLDEAAGNLAVQINRFVVDVQGDNQAHSVLVIDGQTLTAIDRDPSVKVLFTDLAIAADSVICCRASPGQKADLVRTIRLKVKGSVTLAIGDGANDIAMIQEAHLGIGIAGKEGLQAARTSDYSIGQFRFLLKLLLVHGRWNYVRVCKYTLGTFWKEMLFYLVQATYQRWNGYTGTSLYEPWSLSMFNTLFTSLPVIFMGAFEKDLSPVTLLAAPELYNIGQQNKGFTIPLYLWWAFIGALESQIVYFTMYGIYGEALFTRDNQLFAMGALAFTACVTIISLKLQFFELHNKSVMAATAIILSVGGWWVWNLILSAVYDPDNRLYNVNGGLINSFGRNMLWWLTVILIVLAVSVFELVLKTIKTVYFPNDVEVFQVYERDTEIKKRFEESAASLLQAGWDRGAKKPSFEIAGEKDSQPHREAEIQSILDRPRTMGVSASTTDASQTNGDALPTAGIRKRQSWASADLEMIPTNQEVTPLTEKKSADVGELFSRGYGVVRKDSMK